MYVFNVLRCTIARVVHRGVFRTAEGEDAVPALETAADALRKMETLSVTCMT